MKYDYKNRMLTFSTDKEMFLFHDQLTEAMRAIMLNTGNDESAGPEEDMRVTREFFERYSALAETLRHLRAHLPRTAYGQPEQEAGKN